MPTMVQEQRQFVRILRDRRSPEFEVSLQRGDRLGAEIDIPATILLSGAADSSLGEINIFKVEADQLRDPHTC